MTNAERTRHLRVSAKILRHRARVEDPVEISPEFALDVAIALEELVENRSLAEVALVPGPRPAA